MELSETTVGMLSPDYKERFIAEYEQLEIRFLKLLKMINAWDVGRLDFKPTCPREIYEIQLSGMMDYRRALIIRAQLEGIELPKVEVE